MPHGADNTRQNDPGHTRSATTLLWLLISADLAFIALHLVQVETSWFRGVRLSLEADGGLPETYQYVKEFWIAVCMAAIFWRTRRWSYAGWALLFAFLLADDAAQIHEQVGAWLGREMALPGVFGLRPDDLGELLFAAAVGISIITLIGVAAWREGTNSRRVARDMVCLVAALVVAGVVADALHVIAYFRGSLLAQVLLVIEDGGEMLVMSALTAYAFYVADNRGRVRHDFWERAAVYYGLSNETTQPTLAPQVAARSRVDKSGDRRLKAPFGSPGVSPDPALSRTD